MGREEGRRGAVTGLERAAPCGPPLLGELQEGLRGPGEFRPRAHPSTLPRPPDGPNMRAPDAGSGSPAPQPRHVTAPRAAPGHAAPRAGAGSLLFGSLAGSPAHSPLGAPPIGRAAEPLRP